MEKTLELIFKNMAGKNAKISVKDPKEDLTPQEVQAVMDDIIAKNIFETSGGDMVEVGGARLIQKEIIELLG